MPSARQSSHPATHNAAALPGHIGAGVAAHVKLPARATVEHLCAVAEYVNIRTRWLQKQDSKAQHSETQATQTSEQDKGRG